MKVSTEEFGFVHDGLKMLRTCFQHNHVYYLETGKEEEAAKEQARIDRITALLLRFIDEADDREESSPCTSQEVAPLSFSPQTDTTSASHSR